MKRFKRILRAGLLLAALSSANAWGGCSPIVIDLANDGIQLGEAGVGVYFDVNADGVRDHVQWVRRGGDEGFLAMDRTGNGLIDDGAELFGVGTPMILEGRSAPNGFVGLAQYDSRASSAAMTTASSLKPMPSGRSCASGWISTRMASPRAQEMRTLRSLRHHGAADHSEDPQVLRRGGQCHSLLGLGHAAAREPGRVLMVDVFFRQLPKVSGT